MKETVRFAFLKTIPVMLGYLFLGLAFGLLLQEAGYSFWWALLASTIVYAGSIQFVLVSFLGGGTSLPAVAVMTLLINSRHAFYGLSFVEKFRKMKTYPYMVFSLTDETYSLLCSLKTPAGVDEKKAMFLISLFDQMYWIAGSVAGAALGQVLPFDMTGIDFAMTALFVTIFVDQWREAKSHLPAVAGLISAVVCLLIFGGNNFILPSLIITVGVLMGLCEAVWRQSERKGGSVMTRGTGPFDYFDRGSLYPDHQTDSLCAFGGKRKVPKAVEYLGADPALRPSWPLWWYTV